jgi:hypothetical protein
MEGIRSFIAIDLPEEAKNLIRGGNAKKILDIRRPQR